MTQEIIEAVREIERDKGIEQGTLVQALEDALLAAYKKTPGASSSPPASAPPSWRTVPARWTYRTTTSCGPT